MNVLDILASPWAIIPDHLQEITAIYSGHVQGGQQNIAEIEAGLGRGLERKPQGYHIANGVAIIPVEGIIAKKMNMFSQVSGGVSTQLVERDFLEALEDDEVQSIILHVDSPGGPVDGTAELADTVFKGRGQKPIYTLVDGLMASAAVWIGSAADKVFISSVTASVGSIGVVTQHVDYSARQKKLGVTVTDIYAGKYKRIASKNMPLSDDGREDIQSQVDYLYSIFVDRVAEFRGTTTKNVLENMADGRMFIGQQAIDAGLVDGVATLDKLIGMLQSGAAPRTGQAHDQSRPAAAATSEETIKTEWEGDANLRAEFGYCFERFDAYKRAGFRRLAAR